MFIVQATEFGLWTVSLGQQQLMLTEVCLRERVHNAFCKQFLFVKTLVSVYVDASDSCNTAAFQLGQTAVGTALASRTWNIKVNLV
jgi:hypothetical protein